MNIFILHVLSFTLKYITWVIDLFSLRTQLWNQYKKMNIETGEKKIGNYILTELQFCLHETQN